MKKKLFFKVILFLFWFLLSTAVKGYIIDSMEYSGLLLQATGGTVDFTMKGVPGKVGNCVEISYEYKEGDWFQIYRMFDYISLKDGDQIRFWYKGEGAANTMEFWVTDKNEKSHALYYSRATFQPAWAEKIISLSDFSDLDLSIIKSLKFAVSRKTGDDGGCGYLLIDNVELYQSADTPAVMTNIDDFEGNDSDYTNLTGGVNIFWAKNDKGVINAVDFSQSYGTLQFLYDSDSEECVWQFVIDASYKDQSRMKYLRFQIRGYKGGEVIGVGLKYGGNSEKYVMLPELTTDFQEILIPLKAFSAQGADLSDIKEIQFWFMANREGLSIPDPQGDVTIYLDDLMFYIAPKTKGTKRIIDNMDFKPLLSPWKTTSDPGSSIDISLVDGYVDQAYKMEYDLGTGDWVRLERDFNLNLFEGGGIKFYFRGEGDPNNLDIQLEDDDGTIYWKKYYNFTDTGNKWKEVAIGFDELAFKESGDDDNFNLKQVQAIYLGISKYEEGKQGTVAIDEFRSESPLDYELDPDTYKVFKKVEVPDIVFSPNNDYYKDTLCIIFSLKQKARVSLRIYNLAGNVIKEFSAKEYLSDQEYTYEWDGKDFNNKIVRNGIYLFQIKAITFDGQVERVNHGVAVVK